jgi:hypothetical protein
MIDADELAPRPRLAGRERHPGGADRNERHGRTYEEARELCCKAAKSAAICGMCFRPLAPTDSVTMMYGRIGKNYWLRVPICLLCTLDDQTERFIEPRYWRRRCLNCGRPIRIFKSWYGISHPPSLNARACWGEMIDKRRRKRRSQR